MSDNRNISMEDRGWDEMRAILDKELPVKKKRRLAIWLLFSGMAIGLVVLIGLMIFPKFESDAVASNVNESSSTSNFEKSETSSTEQLKTNTQPISNTALLPGNEVSNQEMASKNVLTEGAEVIKNENIEKAQSTQIYNSKNSNQKSSFIPKSILNDPSTTSRNNPSTSPPSNLSTSTLIEAETEINFAETRNEGTKFNDENKVAPDPQIQKPEISDPNEKLLDKSSLEINSLESILLFPLLQLPLVKQPRLKRRSLDFALVNPIINVDKPNAFSSYLLASSSYQPNNRGLGYGIGAGLNYGNSRQEIYLEAGYFKSSFNRGSLSTDFSPDAVVSVLENDDGDINTSFSGSSFDLSVSNFEELTTSIEELRVSLGARKKISRKFNLDIGISYARLLKATNKSLAAELEFASTLDKNIVTVNSNQLYNSGAYSDFDIVPHFGIEYDLNSKFYFGIFYNFGLKNLIATTQLDGLNSLSADDAIYRRNISAKIRYRF